MLNKYHYKDRKWSFNTDDPVQMEFLRSIHNLSVILKDTVSLEHGYIEHRQNENEELFVPFQPTTFIYAFFVLNILYNYDWPKSLLNKYQLTYENRKPRPSETQKLEYYNNFCFEDSSFYIPFKKRFKAILNIEFGDTQIIDTLKQIKPDKTISEEAKDSFINSFKRILEEGNEDEFRIDVYNCLSFIYIIRCNVIHGTKTVKEILDNDIECKKLKIYSWFIIASCQMCFSYLEYKRVPFYPLNSKLNNTYDTLIENQQMY